MPTPEEIKQWTRATFNSAADHFDDPPLAFWDLYGTRTVELTGIVPGKSVLDVCCGSGASALPAAAAVGPAGSVTAVDFAERLLDLGRAKAERRGLTNISFESGDMTDLRFEDESFDYVVCVFGIFFAPDIPVALSGLWKKVRPGGTLAITVWGQKILEPGNTVFWEAVEAVRPDLKPKGLPFFDLNTPEKLEAVFASAVLPPPQVLIESVATELSPEDYWTVVIGSGYRGPINLMNEGESATVRLSILASLAKQPSRSMVSDVIYARLVKG